MSRVRQGAVIRNVQALFESGTMGNLTDGQLLHRFTSRCGEAAELAFAILVERHGPMVLRTCCSILRDRQDVDDAFQATFLVLVRRARSLWVRDSLGAWLHQVAYRTASCARSAAARRRRHEQAAAERTSLSVPLEFQDDELRRALHEELARLPAPFRAAIVLCLVEGLTHEQAAGRIGCPLGTLESRLARGRARLRTRLSRRGLAPTMGALTAALAAGRGLAATPPALVEATLKAAFQVVKAKGRATAAEAVSASAMALMVDVSRSMSMSVMKLMVGGLAVAVGLAVVGKGMSADQRDQTREAKQASGAPMRARDHQIVCPVSPRENCMACHLPQVATQPMPPQPAGDQPTAIVARVNDTPIARDALVEQCLAKYGAKELEVLINKAILERECQRRGIIVTAEQVDAEAAHIATQCGMNLDAFFQFLEKQRGLSKEAYLHDIVHPNLMAEKLKLVGSFTSFEELKNRSRVEVYFTEPRAHGTSVQKPIADPDAQRRLEVMERKLDETLKSLENLKRELKR